MPDPFASFAPTLTAPFRHQFDASAAASDTADLPYVTRGVYVGGGGDLKFTAADDATPQTWKAVPQGTFIDGAIKRVYATGTTATFLIGVY